MEPENPASGTQSNEQNSTPSVSGLSWQRVFKSSSTVGIIAAVATMLGTVVATFTAYRGRDFAERQAAEASISREFGLRAQIEAANAKEALARLQQENAALRKTLEHGVNGGQEKHYAELNPIDRQTLNQIKADQEQLKSRFAALETTLMTTPEKAVAVPMLKQQIDTLQDRSHADLDSVRGEIGRLFTMTQWFIGLMFTIALGVFGLALSNLKKATEKQPEKERTV